MPLRLENLKSTLILTLLLSLSPSALAATIQTPKCEIFGDPDVYGVGIRWSFYLQWGALVIFLLACPRNADICRVATSITTIAVYANTFRNMREGSLVAVEFPLLWYMTSSLSVYNWPVSREGFKKNGGSLAIVLLIWSMYYLASPWVFFKGLEVGREPGCQIKYFLFAPINVYARGFRIFMKVSSVIGAVLFGGIAPIGALYLGGLWIQNWGERDIETYQQDPNPYSAVLGFLQLTTGAITIAFTEMTLKTNNITFPDTKITNSGQLIALLIGIFTFSASLVSAIRALVT
ncbi:MAG: hypothetical protein M1839_004782 [Geoglossum umbratile]|nr:MAG: hypothetical protein M1839_004782 [Geoglossum umbratile]